MWCFPSNCACRSVDFVAVVSRATMLLPMVALSACLPSYAISASDPIDTNRPSFMFSPLVLPQGSIQFENGTLYQGFQHRHWTYDVPETQVRVGVLKSTELQIYVPNAFLWHTGNMTNGKVADLTEIGIKSHLGPESSKFNASVIADITVPTGSPVVSGSGVQAAFRLPWGVNIKQWSVAGMQSLLILNKAKNLQYFPDLLLSRNIGSKSAVFIEYGGYFTQRMMPVNLIHFGGVYKITPHQQLDIQFGFGMNRAAPTAFVGAGYSFRIDALEHMKWAKDKEKTGAGKSKTPSDNGKIKSQPTTPQAPVTTPSTVTPPAALPGA